jgi:hypothetical protein
MGPLLCFLIYINDMDKSIPRTSTLRLVADDSLLYRPVNTTYDDKRLQEEACYCSPPHQHRLSDVELAMKKPIYVCSIMLHLVEQTLMWHGVKRLGKVQYQHINLFLLI